MKDEIFNKIVAFIAENHSISRENITMDSSFQDLDMDSLDSLSLINELESIYNIQIDNKEVSKIKTVGNAVETLDKLIVA
jgi:acyl carrier protein